MAETHFFISICFSLVLLLVFSSLPAEAQTEEDDIWRQAELENVDFSKQKNHCVRLYAYYRYVDEGKILIDGREFKMYRAYDGICSLDIRYGHDADDGALPIVGRNLVHPEKEGKYMDFYELKPYTFLEKARREPQKYTMETTGDTTRVYTKRGLAGTAVLDTIARELRMDYNALSPDTAYSINLLIMKAHMSHVDAHAVYRLDDADISYVPQGNLKHAVFEGDIVIESMSLPGRSRDGAGSGRGNLTEMFHECTELYVDSVVYMTRDDYRADQRLTARQRAERSGYTQADIERLRQKLGAPPLTEAQRQRIEDQYDWDDQMELWMKTVWKNKYKEFLQ